ncbi:hypothetical protein [Pseudomonas sp. MRSN 12121]|uniref:hypothetical protein n=1 Tax=Pseudomonas sp. MRSN 12121 TaxID=1611770 RepID=UPI0012E06AAD|nr:hypothetical protein [Pseudomonas sp. MRSN 12121]
MQQAPSYSRITRPKWPRQHAQLILAAGSDTAREVLWAKVPAEWQAMVQDHVSLGEDRAQQHVRQREKFRPAVSPATPATADYRAPVHVPGNPVIAAQHLAALRATIQSPRASQ